MGYDILLRGGRVLLGLDRSEVLDPVADGKIVVIGAEFYGAVRSAIDVGVSYRAGLLFGGDAGGL